MKTVEGCSPHFGVSSGKGFHIRLAAVETKPKNSKLQLQQKTIKRIQGLFLLSSWHIIYLCPANAVCDGARTLQNSIVVKNDAIHDFRREITVKQTTGIAS